MKNIPDIIYLQVGEDDEEICGEIDFEKDLTDVTWCQDRIGDRDIEYIRLSQLPGEEELYNIVLDVIGEHEIVDMRAIAKAIARRISEEK